MDRGQETIGSGRSTCEHKRSISDELLLVEQRQHIQTTFALNCPPKIFFGTKLPISLKTKRWPEGIEETKLPFASIGLSKRIEIDC